LFVPGIRHRGGDMREDPLMAQRTRDQHERRRTRQGTPYEPRSVHATVEAAVAACRAGAARAPRDLVEAVARSGTRGGGPPGDAPPRSGAGATSGPGAADPVDRALAGSLVDTVAAAWQLGWQPADLHRAVARRHGRAHARLAARAVGHEAGRHPDRAVPPRWRLQLDAIGAAEAVRGRPDGPWVVPRPAPGPEPGGAASPARVQAVQVAIETLATLRSLPPLPKLGPIPGEAGATAGRRAPRGSAGGEHVGADPRVLHKVTSLLAKAESTNFPGEAEALTAKAQELMTRHAIDRAHLDAGRGGAGRVGGRRVGIDDPYAGARHLLLSAVADANRCRAVWSRQWGFATLFGDEGDLDAVELLYTSLLVQATRAMVAQPRPPSGTAGGTRSFRHSFLVAFAHRIGDRLREADEAVTAQAAQHSAALVPVFEQRRRAAEDALNEAYPTIGTTRLSARNAEGWQAGRRAADRAQLGVDASVRAGARRALR
jgi:hypothetical protein